MKRDFGSRLGRLSRATYVRCLRCQFTTISAAGSVAISCAALSSGCAKASVHVSAAPAQSAPSTTHSASGTVVTNGHAPEPGSYTPVDTVFFTKVLDPIESSGLVYKGIGYLPVDADQDSMPFSFDVPSYHGNSNAGVAGPMSPWRSGVAYLRSVGGANSSGDSIVWTDSTTLETVLIANPTRPVRELVGSPNGKWIGWVDSGGVANILLSQSQRLVQLGGGNWSVQDLQLGDDDMAAVRGGPQGGTVRVFHLSDPVTPVGNYSAVDFRLQISGSNLLLLTHSGGYAVSLVKPNRSPITVVKSSMPVWGLSFVDAKSVAYVTLGSSQSRVSLVSFHDPIDSDQLKAPAGSVQVATLALSNQEVKTLACPTWSNGSLFYSLPTKEGHSIMRTRLLDQHWTTDAFAKPDTLETGFVCPVTLPTE